MQDFYKIPIQQLADFTTQTYLGMNSSLKFKIWWFNYNVKTMVGLRGIEDLIPRHIRIHFQAIQDGHVGYFHMELYKDNVGMVTRSANQKNFRSIEGDRNQIPGEILHWGLYICCYHSHHCGYLIVDIIHQKEKIQNGVWKTIQSFCLLSNNGWIKFPTRMLISYFLKEFFLMMLYRIVLDYHQGSLQRHVCGYLIQCYIGIRWMI